MAAKPLILALANPEPEILPEAREGRSRPDAIIATGRSDYPNQVNNVLCFPFIFRGALDVGATTINEAMKLACVRAIAELAKAEQSDVVAPPTAAQDLSFGPEYLIPQPVRSAPDRDDRAGGGRRRRWRSGVATRPIADFDAYRAAAGAVRLPLRPVMKPVFAAATKAPKRIVYAEGEDERVLRAVQVVVDERLATPDPGRPAGGDRAGASSARPAPASRAATSSSSIPTTIRAIASTGRGVLPARPRATASSREYAQAEMRRAHHADRRDDDARGRRRRHAVRHVRHAIARICDYIDRGDRPARRASTTTRR